MDNTGYPIPQAAHSEGQLVPGWQFPLSLRWSTFDFRSSFSHDALTVAAPNVTPIAMACNNDVDSFIFPPIK
jgi:hypothetical protein